MHKDESLKNLSNPTIELLNFFPLLLMHLVSALGHKTIINQLTNHCMFSLLLCLHQIFFLWGGELLFFNLRYAIFQANIKKRMSCPAS